MKFRTIFILIFILFLVGYSIYFVYGADNIIKEKQKVILEYGIADAITSGKGGSIEVLEAQRKLNALNLEE